MKAILVLATGLISLFSISAQELGFIVSSGTPNVVTIATAHTAESLQDLIPGYPSSWISAGNYISSSIEASFQGKFDKANGTNQILSTAQKDLFLNSSVGTEFQLEVKYRIKNTITSALDQRTINFDFKMVPDQEAEYQGGEAYLRRYIKENAIDKIAPATRSKIEGALLSFYVDQNGNTIEIVVVDPTPFEATNSLLLEAIKNMPKWIPAENNNGKKVKQQFKLSIGSDYGC